MRFDMILYDAIQHFNGRLSKFLKYKHISHYVYIVMHQRFISIYNIDNNNT